MYKQINQELRQALADYRETGRNKPLSMAVLARELGTSATAVNKYLNDKFEGDVTTMENTIADVLQAARKRRRASAVAHLTTSVTNTVQGMFETIRKTNDIGMVSGPAGIGKSIAIAMYLKEHPSAVAINLTRWRRDFEGLAGLLFNAIDNSSWPRNVNRSTWLCDRFLHSNRLIIVDNAHRMTASAREWVFDFHDCTCCPFALVGNPELLAAIRRNDQQFSRIGVNIPVEYSPHRRIVRAMVDDVVVDAPAELYTLADEVSRERGHLRALRKQLLLAIDLLDADRIGNNVVTAFHAAHELLVRDYQL